MTAAILARPANRTIRTIPANRAILNHTSLAQAVIPQLAAKHFLVFCKLDLDLEIAGFHKKWAADLQTGEDCVELGPRDHGKSMVLIRAYAIWKARHDPFIKEVLILGGDEPSAIENLDKIKEMLEASGSLRYLLPTTRKMVNARKEIRLTNGVKIKAKAYFSTLRGRHPQLILMDDCLNERNSLSDEGRKKVRNYFFQTVFPMKDKGTKSMKARGYKPQIVISGNVQHEEDLYLELLADGWTGTALDAIVNDQQKQVLWKERYSYDDLMKIKEKVGTLNFAKEYRNTPIQDESSLFPPDLFKPLLDYDRSWNTEYTYQGTNPVYEGVDFSVPGSTDGDFTVAITGERTTGETILLNAIWRDLPLSMQSQTDKIHEITTKMKVTLGYLEANMFQKVYSEHFKNKTILPLKGHVVTASGKNSWKEGLLSFRPLFENGKFRFPYKTPYDREMTDLIVREFGGLIRKDGKLGNFRFHDDCVMAMWHLLRASRAATFSYSM